MMPRRVHFLSCETRRASVNGTAPRNLYARTRRRLPEGVVVRNLCVELRYSGTMLRPQQVLKYAQAAAPSTLLVFTDTDVVFNVKLTSEELIQRFEVARAGARVLFQADQTCFAPREELIGGRRRPRTLCSEQMLHAYATVHGRRPWDCPRFLNAGGYAGYAEDLLPILRLWSRPRSSEVQPCTERPRFGWDDQCVATSLLLRHNASIALDTGEAIFAAAAAVRPCTANRAKCWECGRPKEVDDKRRPRCEFDDALAWEQRVDGLYRPSSYLRRCGTALAPLAIHFNGPAKRLVAHPMIQSLSR